MGNVLAWCYEDVAVFGPMNEQDLQMDFQNVACVQPGRELVDGHIS